LEEELLDKAGALRDALPLIDERSFFFFERRYLVGILDYDEMLVFTLSKKAKLTIAVRPWKDLSRVDPVKVDKIPR